MKSVIQYLAVFKTHLVPCAICDTIPCSFQDPTLCLMRWLIQYLAVFKTLPCAPCDQWYSTLQFSRPYIVPHSISDTVPCSVQDPTLCHMPPVILYLAVFKTPTLCLIRSVMQYLAVFKTLPCVSCDQRYSTLQFSRPRLVPHAISNTVPCSFQDPTLCHMRSVKRYIAVFMTSPCASYDQWYGTLQFSRPYIVPHSISDTVPCSVQDPTLCHMPPVILYLAVFKTPTLCLIRSVMQYLAVFKTLPCVSCDQRYSTLQFSRPRLVPHAISNTVPCSFQDPTLCHMRSVKRYIAVFMTSPCASYDQWYGTLQFLRPYLVSHAISDTVPCSFQEISLCALCDRWYGTLQFSTSHFTPHAISDTVPCCFQHPTVLHAISDTVSCIFKDSTLQFSGSHLVPYAISNTIPFSFQDLTLCHMWSVIRYLSNFKTSPCAICDQWYGVLQFSRPHVTPHAINDTELAVFKTSLMSHSISDRIHFNFQDLTLRQMRSVKWYLTVSYRTICHGYRV